MTPQGSDTGSKGGLSPEISDPGLLERSRVMIVDDNPANVVVIERLLRREGLEQVECCTDSQLALDRCLESLPDLVLLDLHMPGLDGFAVMDALRSYLPEGAFLPVLVLTGDDSTEVKQRALAAGAKDFLTKPFDPIEVVLRVRNLLETRDLYARMQRHNARLQHELDEQHARERREAAEYEERAQRVEQVLAAGAVSMVFQPIVSLVDGRLLGVEALARFDHEPRRPPNEWFAEADPVGRGVEMELDALAAALAQLDGIPADAYMSINASPVTALTLELKRLLERYPGNRVALELTEHTRVDDYAPLLDALDHFKLRGVRIAVDDTGAGYSGLQHLLRLCPNVVKLDVALTRGIDVDPARRALASALVTFAKEIDAVLVAEGVEFPGELSVLRALGITAGQGFLLARPGPMHALLPDYRHAFTD